MTGTKLRGPGDVDSFLKKVKPPLDEIARTLRSTIRHTAPSLEEGIKWGMPAWVGKRNVCYIAPYSQHVNLGFYQGAEFVENAKLLEGTGKGLRHIKVRSVGQAKSSEIISLVREAVRIDAA